MQTVDTFIARIRRNIADPDAASAMMLDTRGACEDENWDRAMDALGKADTPLALDGIRYDTTGDADRAIDAAAHAVWDGIRDLIEPEIRAEAEAGADQAVEAMAEDAGPDDYLDQIRYWDSVCFPRPAYETPFDRLRTWEQFRETAEIAITHVVKQVLYYAVMAELLRSQLTDEHYRALTWPFEDLTDGSTSEER